MKTKKILSVLLAVVMALSCMTVMASAYLAPDRNPEVGQNLPLVPQEIHPDLSTYVETAVDYGNLSPEAAKDIADRLVKAIDPAVAGQLTGIIDGIFTNANLGKLMHMLWTALSGMGTFAPKPSGYASIAYYKPGTEDTAKYEKALAVIKATSNDWSDFAGFQNGDCGFNDGDIDGFVDAFAAMMRPLSFALIALKIGNYNEKVDGQYHYTYGMYDAFLPLFEILELDNVVSSVDMIDNGANYISTDGTFVQFLKPIAGLIKDVKAAPAATIIDLLPKLAYAVESGILDTAFSKSMTWLGPVFSLIGLSYPDNLSLTAEGIWDTIIAADLDNDAETATLAEQIADMDITLTKDFFVKTIKALAGCGKAVEKSSVSKESTYRLAVETNAAATVMTVYNAVAEFLGTEGNVEALGHLVVGAYISKENYYGFVNAVKADDAALAIGYIFAAVSEYAAEKEVEAEPDGPFAWFYKLIKIITDFIRKVLGVKA